MKVHWVITSPNYKGVPKPNLGIRSLFAKSNRCYGLDDRMLHPQLVSKGFEWAVCIPKKTDKFPGLWWRPTEND
ncbi:hypothetical protein FA13DRAFT_1646079, partial [Coprinellus micaceus]